MPRTFRRLFPRSLWLFLVLSILLAAAPPLRAGEGAFSFLVVGDWGRDGLYHQKDVADRMGLVGDSLDIVLTISTGDNFYPRGVKSVDDPQWKSSYEDVYTAPVLQRTWYAVLGNHDWRGHPQAEIDYTLTSDRWNMPDHYYNVVLDVDDSTTVEFFFLDTTPFYRWYKWVPTYCRVWGTGYKKQLAWLKEGLAASNADWKIVVGHHTIYSSNPHHGDSKKLQRLISPLLEKYGAQAYFCGHDHDLQHQSPPGHVQYFISGAGSEVTPDETNKNSRFAKSISGFMAVSLTHSRMKVRIYDYKGDRLYTTRVGRDGSLVSDGR